MIRYVIQTLKRSFTLKGRANRAEYWSYFVFVGALFLSIVLIDSTLHIIPDSDITVPIVIGFLVVTGLPGIALEIRRLHDFGFSGWWFIGFFALFFILEEVSPDFGSLFHMLQFIIMGLIPSNGEHNKYGSPAYPP